MHFFALADRFTRGRRLVVCLGLAVAAHSALALAAGSQAEGQPSDDAAAARIAEEHAFLELETERDTYFLHEPIRVRVRFGFDTAFLRSNVVQMFSQHLDVPAQISAPWLEDLPGTVAWTGASSGRGDGERLTFALDESSAEAVRVEDRLRGGRPFTVLEFERGFLPVTTGERVIPQALLRFAYAMRFEEDFLNGRVALDRRDVFVVGGPLLLEVEPLPEAGRPFDFHGAVGRFTVRSEANPTELAVGESLRVLLHVEGEGNLQLFAAPRVPAFEGFQVYGTLDEASATRRSFRYDLAARSVDVREVPAIPFSFFDPGPPAGYRTVHTQPIALAVRPASAEEPRPLGREDALAADPDVPGGIAHPATNGPKEEGSSSRAPYGKRLVVLLVVAALLAIVLLVLLRVKALGRRDPERVRARAAAATFRSRAAEPGADLGRALADFLAARLRCSTTAVIGSDATQRLVGAGIPPELAGRTARQLEELVGARYGGELPRSTGNVVFALVEELERAFRDADPARRTLPFGG